MIKFLLASLLLSSSIASAVDISVEKRGKSGNCSQDEVNLMGDVGNYVVSLPASGSLLNAFDVKEGVYAPSSVECTAGYCRIPSSSKGMVLEYQLGSTLCRVNISGLDISKSGVAYPRTTMQTHQATHQPLSQTSISERSTQTPSPVLMAKTEDRYKVLASDVGFNVYTDNAKGFSVRLSVVGDRVNLGFTKGYEVVGATDSQGVSRYQGIINGKHSFDMSGGQVKVILSSVRNERREVIIARAGEVVGQEVQKSLGMFKSKLILAPGKGSLKEQIAQWVSQDGRGYRLLWAGSDKNISSGQVFSSELIDSLVKFSEITGFKVSIYEMEKEIEVYVP